MDTPQPSSVDGVASLYGANFQSINRRLLLAGLLVLPFGAQAQRRRGKEPAPPPAPRVISLSWQGTAKIYYGDGFLEFKVNTLVQPFGNVRSESWLSHQPPSTRNTLILDGNGAWTETRGGRVALPQQQAAFERNQHAVFGYLLEPAALPVDPKAKPPKRRRKDPPPPPPVDPMGQFSRVVTRPGFPPATLYFDGGRITTIDYQIDPPQPGPRVNERFTMSGEVTSGTVRFPQRIVVTQDGRNYHELNITSFQATMG